MKYIYSRCIFVVMILFWPSSLTAQDAYSFGSFRLFSRANCLGVNESITWSPYAREARMQTISEHHALSGAILTYQDSADGSHSRAGCFDCPGDVHLVVGHHIILETNDSELARQCGTQMQFGSPCISTSASDCNLSVGWF